MKRFCTRLAVPVLIALGLSLGEAGVRSTQVAEAVDWDWVTSNLGSWCEGCCKAGRICCYHTNPCAVTPIE